MAVDFPDELPDGPVDATELEARLIALRDAVNLALQNLGVYNPAKQYGPNDLIREGLDIYFCLADAFNEAPSTTPAKWQKIGGGTSGSNLQIKNHAGASISEAATSLRFMSSRLTLDGSAVKIEPTAIFNTEADMEAALASLPEGITIVILEDEVDVIEYPDVYTTSQAIPTTIRLFTVDCILADQEFSLPDATIMYPLLMAEAVNGKPAALWVANTGTVTCKIKTIGTDKFASTSPMTELPLSGGDTAIITILPRADDSLVYQILTG